MKENYLEIERAGIATIGGFFGFLALLFAGMYCVACYEEPPPPPPPEKPLMIPLHLIKEEEPLYQKPVDRTLYSSHDAPAPFQTMYEQQMPTYFPPDADFLPNDGYMPMEPGFLPYGGQQQFVQPAGFPRRSFMEADM